MDPFFRTLPTPLPAPAITRSALLSLLARYIRVPESSLIQLSPDVSPLLDELERDGAIGRRRCVRFGWLVALDPRGLVEAGRAARELWNPAGLVDFHREAAAFFLSIDDPCSAVYHYEQSGEIDAAIDLLKKSWHRAEFAVGHEEFLALIQRLATAKGLPDDVELLAIRQLAASFPWPSEENASIGLRLLNVVPASIDSLPLRSRIVINAAVVLALTTAGRVKTAISVGEAFVSASLDEADLDPGTWDTMPYFWTSLAETYLTAGLSSKASFFASKAEQLSTGDDGRFPRFRALAIEAVAHGLNGELREARRAADRARELSAGAHWQLGHAHFPLLVSDILVASSCLDGDGLERVSEQLAALPNSRLWASTAAACNAAVHLARGQLAEGTAIIHRALSGTGEWGFLGIIRGFAIGVHADLLLAANAAGEALSLLEDVSSPIGHSLCFDVQRSSAYIMLGRPHDVLKATDACVESGIEHCLRTLPPILLRRAVAFDLLGLSAAADVSFREAILLIKESGSVIGFMNLPQRNVALLVDRLVDHHPEYRAELAAILQQTNGLPTPADKAVDLSLTSRELTVAAMLRSGADPIQIASELFISTNTVKVHLRNVYHKLGVHSRTDALAKIEAVGLYTLEGRR